MVLNGGAVFLLSAFIVWALAAILAAWWLTRAETATEPAGPVPPDPVKAEIDKMMHDWERGRA